MRDFWKHFEIHFENIQFENHWNLWENFENTLKHIIWKHFETHNLKTIETFGRFLKTLWNTLFGNNLKHTIWKPLKPMRNFENTLKHIIWKSLKPMRTSENTLKHIIWKHFETHNLKTLWNTFWKNTIWKPLKPMGNFENTLTHIIWKPLKPMRTSENTLKHIIWKHFETHNLKTIETYEDFWKHFETHYLKTLWHTLFENHWNLWEIFENTLKHIIWKHFETHNLKTIETFGRFLKTLWKPYLYPTELSALRCDHWNLRFSIGTQMKHICAAMHGEKICFFHAVECIDFTTTVWSNKQSQVSDCRVDYSDVRLSTVKHP